MPNMPDVIAKTSYFRLFDGYINSFDQGQLQAEIDAIEGGQTTRDRVQKVPDLQPAGMQHILRHWYGDGGEAWWQEFPVTKLLTEGYLQAYKTMLVSLDERQPGNAQPKPRERRLPLDTLWICTGHPFFNVIVTETEQQVSLLIMTPPSPDIVSSYLAYRQAYAARQSDLEAYRRIGVKLPRIKLPDLEHYVKAEPLLIVTVDSDHGQQPFRDYSSGLLHTAGVSAHRPFARDNDMSDPAGHLFEPAQA